MAAANDALRFALELGTLAAVAYGGRRAGDGWSSWLWAGVFAALIVLHLAFTFVLGQRGVA